MTSPCLALEGVSYVLPDGRTLFSHLDEQFDCRATGLVGRNGVGKTILARILAGELSPASGRCVRAGSVHYLAQQVSPPAGVSVAGLAGAQPVLEALTRIEAGSTAPEDFEAVGDRWDVRRQFRQELERNGLGYLDATTPADILSGGEAMRVALIGAVLSGADFLILDEPSNHLDRPNRRALIEQLQRWSQGLVVISHDRQLLDTMTRIVELSPIALRSYGGNHAFYAQCKSQEQLNALEHLEQRKLERRREEQALREQRERQERRQSRGEKHGKEANQAKILLGRQKERAEVSQGKLRQQQAQAHDALARRVREAAQQVQDDAPIVLHAVAVPDAAQRRVALLDDVELPFVTPAARHIRLILTGRQRVGVVGPNGCGKSTLLKVLAGRLDPLRGSCETMASVAYLDQQLGNLDPQRPVLEQIRAGNATAGEDDLRMRLAHLGLDARKIAVPSGALSGGERLKAALACLLYADTPVQLLLMDEPGNHLDLPSMQALEAMLNRYEGALVVVSHDDAFLNNLRLTDRLEAAPGGWRIDAW